MSTAHTASVAQVCRVQIQRGIELGLGTAIEPGLGTVFKPERGPGIMLLLDAHGDMHPDTGVHGKLIFVQRGEARGVALAVPIGFSPRTDIVPSLSPPSLASCGACSASLVRWANALANVNTTIATQSPLLARH